MAPIWPAVPGTNSTSTAAATASVARVFPVAMLLAMPQTACATTATAAILSPCSQPGASSDPNLSMPSPNSISAMAEGSVKPAQAASAPA